MIGATLWLIPLALLALPDTPGGQGAVPARENVVRNSIGMPLVEIPGGSFDMGSTIGPGEAPVHRVSVRTFWMGVTEVTQAQWQAVMGTNPSHFKKAGPNAPVEMVSWDDAQAFVGQAERARAGLALPPPQRGRVGVRLPGGWREGPLRSGGGHRLDQGELGRHDAPGGPEATECLRALRHVRQRAGVDPGHVASPDYKGAPTDGSAWEGGDSGYHTLRGGGWDLPAFFLHAALRVRTTRFTAEASASRPTGWDHILKCE